MWTMGTHDTAQSYTARLATFNRADIAALGHVSPVILAQNGFYYKRRLCSVLCAECAACHKLEEFLPECESLSPRLSRFHRTGCSFVHQDGCRTLTFPTQDIDLILYNNSLTPTPEVEEKSWENASCSTTKPSANIRHEFEHSLSSKLENLQEEFRKKYFKVKENNRFPDERKLIISSSSLPSSHESSGEPTDCLNQEGDSQTCDKAKESSHESGSHKSLDSSVTLYPGHAAECVQSHALESTQSTAYAHSSAPGIGKSTSIAQPITQEPSQPTSTTKLGTQEPSQPTATTKLGTQEPSQPTAITKLGTQEPSQPTSTTKLGTQEPSQPTATTNLGTQEPSQPTATTNLGTQEPSQPTSSAQLGNQEAQLGTKTPTDVAETEQNHIATAVEAPQNTDLRSFCTAEVCEGEEKHIEVPISRIECHKNPGHFGYFPVRGINLDQIPSQTRHEDLLRLLTLLATLTVKIRISAKTSKHTRLKVGTGCVSLSLIHHLPQLVPNEVPSGKLHKSMLSFLTKNKETIYIETNQNLVADDGDAVNALVEFSHNGLSSSGVKVIKGQSVIPSPIPGDQRCILVCMTSDRNLTQLVSRARDDVTELAERLPRRVKEAMCKKVFIIHHPHGAEKVVSYGDFVVVKYMIKPGEGGVTSRVNNHEVARFPVENLRKVLLYAADTCPGSSGAPVICFKKVTSGIQSTSYVLDMWVHDGVNHTFSLSSSTMKDLTEQDREMIVNPRPPSVPTTPDDDNSLGNQTVTSPVYKVTSHPCYLDYVTYERRLHSFDKWTAHEIHRPVTLARAGFFYAGYADCVRCFQCGLGLRSWKKGDDIFVEHQRHRPQCPFLHIQAERRLQDAASRSTEDLVNQQDAVLMALKKENEKLNQSLLCKICSSAPVVDLFLPCGELIACKECSRLLVLCPCCQKPILATVTTFFT
ncbi:uncharacterized protein LOC131940113 [Physella acuta]|uniref:uncharacterized protein LOC131940113 n=1 Tax=Physella acuta TaxID=109671 RepID=UPI0027DBF038|nr:uncharacterized protein LOC131940113 [Physella acuta]